MSPLPRFSIDLNEEFPRLKSAPSIEAVIHWQADASKQLAPDTLKKELTQRLPEYPICQNQQDIQITHSGKVDGISELIHRAQWSGLRLQDTEQSYVAQFMPAGVIFSRLKPYDTWETFKQEAIRFWDIFLELAEPTVIKRLGIRYINRIPLENDVSPSTYLKLGSHNLPGINISPASFFYKDTYQIPNYPYIVHWTRTIQPQQQSLTDRKALIFDIDVFTTELLQLDQGTLNQRLSEMRWLKNKVFFSCITDTALDRFGV